MLDILRTKRAEACRSATLDTHERAKSGPVSGQLRGCRSQVVAIERAARTRPAAQVPNAGMRRRPDPPYCRRFRTL